MYSDYVSLHSMLAAEQSSRWAFWSMWAMIASAVFTFFTLFVTLYAVTTWRRQESLKLKINFKQALLVLDDALDAMPENWNYIQVNVARMILERTEEPIPFNKKEVEVFFKKKDLQEAYKNSLKCWIMCGSLFEKSNVKDLWVEFEKGYHDYIMKGGNKNNIKPILLNLIESLRIF